MTWPAQLVHINANEPDRSGVMVATTHFTELRTVYSPNSFGMNYLRAGAAFRWQEVYDFLDARGFRAIGGRVGSIGSGLLLGGGLSYFSSVHGWAANNVVNYEIVLANGSIIEVNNRSAPDLFWALKGGSNNFGIITRFDLKIYASNEVWGGLAVYAPEDNQKYLDAQTAFILPGGGSDDPKAALMPNFGYDPTTKQSSTSAFLVYDAPTENHKAFENFTSLRTTSRNLGVQNISKVVSISAGFEPRDRRYWQGKFPSHLSF